MSDNLKKNLLALQKHQENVFKILLDTTPDPAYGAAQSPDGSLVLFMDQNGQRNILTYPENAQAKANEFADRHNGVLNQKRPLFFVSMLAGYEIFEMASRLESQDYLIPRAIYVFEENMDLVRLNLAIRDWTALIENKQVYFFVGPSALDRIEDFLMQDPSRPHPEQVLLLGPQSIGQKVVARLRKIQTETLAEIDSIKKFTDNYYETLPPEELARAYFEPSKLRILLISNKLSYFIKYSVRDIKMALESMGAKVLVLEESEPAHRLSGQWLIHELKRFLPHGVIYIDHLRKDLTALFSDKLPFFTWVQDYMHAVHTSPEKGSISARDMLLGYTDKVDISVFAPEQLFRLPTLTNPLVFRDYCDPPSGDFSADFSFVSNISRPLKECYYLLAAAYSVRGPKVVLLIDEIYRDVCLRLEKGGMWEEFDPFFRSVYPRLKEADPELAEKNDFYYQTYTELVGTALRHQTVEWINETGRDLALWGRGWNKHPTLFKHARGVVENGDDLVAVYRQSNFNIHVNQFSLEHPRLLDGIMSGGFFLIRKAPSTGLLKLEPCMFSSQKELNDKIAYFTAHPDEQKRIIEENQKIIAHWATYTVGIRHVLDYHGLKMTAEFFDGNCADLEQKLAKDTEPLVCAINDLALENDPDPAFFGVMAALTLLIHCNVFSSDAAGRFPELNRYQAKWGSVAWPMKFTDNAKSNIRGLIENARSFSSTALSIKAGALFDSWCEQESRDALAYRLAQRFHFKNEFKMDHRPATALRLPGFLQHRGPESKANIAQATQGTGMSIDNARLHADAHLLLQKNAPLGAWDVLRDVVEDPKTEGKILVTGSVAALRAGMCDKAMDLLDRYESWLERIHCMRPRIKRMIVAHRAHIDFASGRTNSVPNILKNKTPIQNPPPSKHPAKPMAPFILKAMIRFPKSSEICRRIDKMTVCDNLLLLRTNNILNPLTFFDLKNQTPLAQNPAGFDAEKYGPYPAFDQHDDHLYIADIHTPQIELLDDDFHVKRTIKIPSALMGYVEDLAVSADGAVALVDSYHSRLRIKRPDNPWLEVPLHFVKVIATDRPALMRESYLEAVFPPILQMDARVRVIGTRSGFFLSSLDRWAHLDTFGNVLSQGISEFSETTFVYMDESFIGVTPYPPRLIVLNENLDPVRTQAGADSKTPFFNPVAIAKIDNGILVADDYRHCMFQFLIK